METSSTRSGAHHHCPFAELSALALGILPFQIMFGGGVAALALPRLPPPEEMPLGCCAPSPLCSALDADCWPPPPSAVLSATGGVGAGGVSAGAVGAGVAAATGAGVAASPNPPKPAAGLPPKPVLVPEVSEFAAAVGAGVTGGGVTPRAASVGAGVTGGGVAAACCCCRPPVPAPRPASTAGPCSGSRKSERGVHASRPGAASLLQESSRAITLQGVYAAMHAAGARSYSLSDFRAAKRDAFPCMHAYLAV